MDIIYKSPFDHQCKIVSIDSKRIPLQDLKKLILHKEELSNADIDFNIVSNGNKIIDKVFFAEDAQNVFVHISLPLIGGKGGFGSMLRAIGAQIEKTTNREACRDLSGRRLRDVNEEKRLKDWIKKQSERKEEEKRKKEKLKRLADGKPTAQCEYNDDDFEKFRTEIPDIVEESIAQGLQQANSSTDKKSMELKRKKIDHDPTGSGPDIPTCSSHSSAGSSEANQISSESSKKLKKQHNLWLGIDAAAADDDDDDSSDTDSDTASEEDPPPKKL